MKKRDKRRYYIRSRYGKDRRKEQVRAFCSPTTTTPTATAAAAAAMRRRRSSIGGAVAR